MENPKVFISYSHDSEEHKGWVRKLAEDLTANGVRIILDDWYLKIGDNLGAFMEQSIQNSDYTILICTPKFSYKINNRIGGASFEAELIIGNILLSADSQKKFIPVLREGLANDSIPMYLKSKLYADFSNNEKYEISLKSLIRRIFDAPEYFPPNLGNMPDFSIPHNKAANHFVPKARILVAGTGVIRHINDKIVSTAEELGRSLAINSYGLVTGGWPGVDEIVARTFSKELQRQHIPITNYLTQVIVKTDLPAYTGGNLILINRGIEEWTESISISDAIVLIHGVGGTLETARYGMQYNKPLFPIADTGGDSKRIYMELLASWDQNKYINIDKQNFQSLGSEAPGVISELIHLLDLQFTS